MNENFEKNFSVKIDILIKEISECIEKFQMNVAVAKLYTFLTLINDLIEKSGVDKNSLIHVFKKYLIIISAFIPYVANECWEKITKKTDLALQEWPQFNNELLKKDEFNVVVQINGKKRAIINAIHNETEESIFYKSLAIKNVKVILEKTTITKKIFVKNKLLNIVTNEK
jgi:leucyl-tRNA synthetase